jgi:hypothetical protein
MGIPNLMRIPYQTSIVTESQALFKSMMGRYVASFYSDFVQVFDAYRLYHQRMT